MPTQPLESSTAKWSAGECATGSGNWSDASNWTGIGAPSGISAIAEFGASGITTINFDTTTTLGTLLFDAGAPAYLFNIGAPYSLTLAGTGISNLATSTPTFTVLGRLTFINGASAGNAALVAGAGGTIDFSGVTSGTPTAGSIAGAGSLYLGQNALEVGALNTSTTFSGGILDGSASHGSLHKVGTGGLTLTGRSTFTGATSVSGLLEIAAGGRLEGTSGITIAEPSTQTGVLRVTGSRSSVTTPGAIVVGKAGRGTLTLEDGGTVSASTVMLGSAAGSSGTLNLGTGATAGVLSAVSVVAGAGTGSVVNINHSQSAYALSSNLLGALTVNHNGTGTTTLTGTNGYSGNTNLNAGTIRIGASTALGSATSGLAFNGGTLQASATITNFTHAISFGSSGGTIDTGAFSVTTTSPLSGGGRLTKTGTGLLTLSGVSSYTGGTTVSGGALRGTSRSLVGDIVNNASVVFLQTGIGTYAGRMSGSGSLTKLNGGNLTLSGANTFTGGTTVSSGTLTVSGSLASAVTVGESGTLGGNGTINGPVAVAGALAPGADASDSIGTLTVRNNVSFAAGSVFRVDAESSGGADRLDASGTVAVDGAGMEVIANPTGAWQANTSYTLIASGAGVQGQFAGVTTDLAFLTPALSYDATNVYLTLTRNDTEFSSVAANAKQFSTARYLQALDASPRGEDATDTVIQEVTQASVPQARALFEQISGAELTRAARVSRESTSKLTSLLVARLAGAGAANDGGEGLDEESPAGQGLWMRALSEGPDATFHLTGTEGPLRAWRSTGAVAGFDAGLSDTTLLGLTASYARTDVALLDGGASLAQIHTPQVMLYARSEQGPLQINAVAGYARPDYRTQRSLPLLGGAAAMGEHLGRELSLYTEVTPAGYEGEGFQAWIAMGYTRSVEDRYTELGSEGSLTIAGRASQWLTSDVGVRFARRLAGGTHFVRMRASWSHDYLDTSPILAAHLADDTSGAQFSVADGPAPRDRFRLEMSLTAGAQQDVSLRLNCTVNDSALGPSRAVVSAGIARTW